MVTNKEDWTTRVSGIVVDALIKAKLVKEADFERAVAVTEEEIKARLALEDWPTRTGPNSK